MSNFENKLNLLFEDVIKEDLIDNAGEIDVTTMKDEGDIKIQWMRNAEGVPPQPFGNQEIVFPLNEKTYREYIEKSDKTDAHEAIKNANSYEELLENFKQFLTDVHHKNDQEADVIVQGELFMKTFKKMIRKNKWSKWLPVTEGELPFAVKRMLPFYSNQDVKWALQVIDFNSEEAKLWGSTADSDVYANINPQDKKTIGN